MANGYTSPLKGLSRREWLRLALGVGAMTLTGATAARPSIQTRPIPKTGERLPVVGLGTWQTFDVGRAESERAPLREVLKALAHGGGKVVDSSPMYGESETVVGDLAAELGLREKLFLATKVWTTGREDGIEQMEESLRRMRTRRMDLMQVHNLVDWRTHLETLQHWKDQGKVRYVGITHYTESAHDELASVIKAERLDFLQVNYSLLELGAENRLLPLAAERGVAVIINRPFAYGQLFRRVRGRSLPSWAAEIGCTTWAQFFLKFILGHPSVTCAIPGTSKVRHLLDNLQAGFGSLPDAAMRKRMVRTIAGI